MDIWKFFGEYETENALSIKKFLKKSFIYIFMNRIKKNHRSDIGNFKIEGIISVKKINKKLQ